MILSALTGIAATVAAVAQEVAPATDMAANTIAANPAVAARGFRFLIGAYTAVWTILAVYLLTLSIRLHHLSSQVRRLKERSGP
jgi:CcmD family protein